jgi:hypothetical protein
MTGLLRQATRLLPADQRPWAEAMLAEVDSVPAGAERLGWLRGALWVTARRVQVLRTVLIGVVATGAAVAVIRYGWHGDWDNPATPVNRIFLVSIVVVLAALPWLTRSGKIFGPVCGNTAARVLRVGGYLAVCALLPIVISVGNFAGARVARCGECSPAEQQQWQAERVGDAVGGSLIIFVLMALYAAGILWMTARRVSISPAAQAVGGGCAVVGGLAVYGLSPTGRTWDAGRGWLNTVIGLAVVLVVLGTPMVAGGWAAARSRTSTPSEDWLKQGILAGTVVGAVGALLITVLTIPTMLVFPDRVPLKWANPSPLVPHGTVFEIQMSLGDAAVGYIVWLLLGPLLGATLGLAGAWMSEWPQRWWQRRRKAAVPWSGHGRPQPEATGAS